MLPNGNRWWAVIGTGAFTQPGLYPVSVTYNPPGAPGTNRTATASLTVTDREFPTEYIELPPDTAALLAPEIVNAELNLRTSIYSGYTTHRYWSGAFVAPSSGPLSSRYGEGRSYNGGPVTDYHKGTDFVGDEGSPIVAAAAGRVVFTGTLKVRGNSVIIDHGAGVFTAYHHLSRIDVAEGAMVTAGQLIGLMGATGLVTGPHLHWEVVVRGVEVDGEAFLKGSEIGP
jgi:murein DD-endopeptidase MepM/ murein hydrolase activator NlpD